MPPATTIAASAEAKAALLITAAREADAAAKAAAAALASARAELLAFMEDGGHTRLETEAGTATVCKGRRTVKVSCKALQAEIKLMQERAVRTGRAVETIGNPYVTIR